MIQDLKRSGVGIVHLALARRAGADCRPRLGAATTGNGSGRPYAETSIDDIVVAMVGRSLDEHTRRPPARRRRAAARAGAGAAGRHRTRGLRAAAYGEILGFAGLIGAGRTEAARAVFGADPVEAAHIELQGRSLRIRSPIDAIREGLAIMSEDRKAHGLPVNMSVAHEHHAGQHGPDGQCARLHPL